jgi:dinuclear metal center YbgI/SA1388 family protein
MDLLQLVAELDELLDVGAVSDYGPNGLQVEGVHEVQNVVTAVSSSRALFTVAAEHDADAILVHHGLLWNGSEAPRVVGAFRDRLRILLENRMSLIAYHLPLDRHPRLGNAAQLALRLGLTELEPFGLHHGATVGVCGVLREPLHIHDLAAQVAQTCDREPQLFAGSGATVTSIGIVTGGAEREYHQAVSAGLDAYITGEAAEWVMHQAAEDGVHYIAAGHYATERFGVLALGEWLHERHGLEVQHVELPNPV